MQQAEVRLEPNSPSDAGSAGPTGESGRVLLGRFHIERTLGRGGMGEIFLAHDRLLNRRVAIKRLSADGTDMTIRRHAILREARRASQINDRRIAAIYDVLDLGDDVLLVMEYVDGTTLRRRLNEPISLTEFWNLATQCVEATAAAHAHGVIHRDLKPENLMLTRDGSIKVLDFGIAKRSEGSEGTTTLVDSSSQMVVGTPHYMAPEAHLGARVDARADQFSLGVVFYEMLTRTLPFDGTTYAAIVHKVLNVTPPPARVLNSEVGPRLSDTVARMLEKDPAARFATSQALLEELTQVRDEDVAPVAKRPGAPRARTPSIHPALAPPRKERTRALAWVYGSAALLVLVLVAVGWARWNGLGAALPNEKNVAVLAPVTPGADADFTSFALGFTELLSDRLRRLTDQPGFQVASFADGFDQRAKNAADARQILGASLALQPTIEQRPDVLRVRLDLFDTARGRLIATRTIQGPVAEPFPFLDRTYRDASAMLRVKPRGDVRSELGLRGAGTLRFYLQGVGRWRAATSIDEARSAADNLELACRTEPEAAAPRAGLAAAQLAANSFGDADWLLRAEASAREAIRLDSTRAEGHRVLGQVLKREKKPEEALSETRRASELDPTRDDLRSSLGRAYGLLGQSEQEKEVYLAGIRQRPHAWESYWMLATWYFRQGRVDESIHAYEDMIRRAPLLNKGYNGLGGLLVLRGDYDRAIEMLKHSVALSPTKTAFDNLGTAYFNSGRLQETIDSYNQSFQFGFADYESWLNLGDAYFWLRNRSDQAAEAYRQAVRLGREEITTRAQRGRSADVTIAANLSTVFPKLAQPDSARIYLAKALAADSSNTQVQYCAALTSWQLGAKERAMDWLQKSVDGGYPTVWLRDSPVFREWHENTKFQALIAPPHAGEPQAAVRGGGGSQ
jgi:serine/threonine-protein kinase